MIGVAMGMGIVMGMGMMWGNCSIPYSKLGPSMCFGVDVLSWLHQLQLDLHNRALRCWVVQQLLRGRVVYRVKQIVRALCLVI